MPYAFAAGRTAHTKLRGVNSMNKPEEKPQSGTRNAQEFDVVVIGAGFGGLYALHRLRESGLSVRCFDGAEGVGGTWWWNRYPGARVDFPSAPFYAYSFSEELLKEWDWQERQPAQAEVLAYLDFAAKKFDLYRDIQLDTWITGAVFDEAAQRWSLETRSGEYVSTQFLICAMGTLSTPNKPNIPGIDDFAGEFHHTGKWPAEPVDFSGKRVGVIGTGSSGIQTIPIIAKQADHLTVFQRTPQYSIPAGNRPLDPEILREARDNWPHYKELMFASGVGMPYAMPDRSAHDHTPEQRNALYEELWQDGGLHMLFNSYNDLVIDEAANNTITDFIRGKIGEIVQDADVAKKLMPDYLLATKRQVIDDGYYESFNRSNVQLVDLREDAIEKITATGITTAHGEHQLDMLVLATGYDAITGALLNVNPQGRGGEDLKSRWHERFNTYLGVTLPGFPNLFMVHGPESPSVLFNMPFGGERESDWIAECIQYLRDNDLATIEPAPGVEVAWGENVAAAANLTLFPKTESWYSGANISGKHRQFVVHLGGQDYFKTLADVADNNYEGFVTEPANQSVAKA
jgi:cation diffusion facilitator CzcD-associated flavoprotein CzcO